MRLVFTDREAEFMEVLWDHGPSTVSEVRERLKDEPAYTTVLTILRNLEGKGFVGPTKDGRAHRYTALVERDTARHSALRDLSAKFFRGSSEQMLTHLVSSQKLNDAQLDRIQELLDQRRKKDKQ